MTQIDSILRNIKVLLKYRKLKIMEKCESPIPKMALRVYTLADTIEKKDQHNNYRLVIALESLGKTEVTNIMETFKSVTHIIFYGHVSIQAKHILDSYAETCFCEVLTASDVTFDKCANVLVPTYRVLTQAEIDELVQTRKTTVNHFPKMLRTDPMARYLGFRVGQVVHAIEPDVYRIVT